MNKEQVEITIQLERIEHAVRIAKDRLKNKQYISLSSTIGAIEDFCSDIHFDIKRALKNA